MDTEKWLLGNLFKVCHRKTRFYTGCCSWSNPSLFWGARDRHLGGSQRLGGAMPGGVGFNPVAFCSAIEH